MLTCKAVREKYFLFNLALSGPWFKLKKMDIYLETNNFFKNMSRVPLS
jgi:hypothetical protein